MNTTKWVFVPAEDSTVDSEHRLLVNGQDVGISIQDARAYAGYYGIGREIGEGDEFAIADHGQARSLKKAKAIGERMFRTGH